MQEIDDFNLNVIQWIRDFGTYTNELQGRKFHMEADCYRVDGAIDGFIGWWDDNHSIKSICNTPWELLNDLP